MIAILCVVVSGLIMTVDAQRWYARFGWVDGLVPVRRPERDPTVDWLRDHSEWGVITGPYWEVYRLAFLAGRPLRAIPMAGEPDRFPEWSQSDEPRILIVPRSRSGLELLEEAYRQGAIELHRSRERVVLMLPEAGARRFKGTSTTRGE